MLRLSFRKIVHNLLYISDNSSEYEELDPAAIEFRGHQARIQRQMVALLPKYVLSEKLNKQLKNLDTKAEVDKANVRAEIVQAYLDVATNVTMYCTSMVSKSGRVTLN